MWASTYSVRVWEASTGKEATAFKGGLIGYNCVAAFSRDGKLLAWGGYDGQVHVRKVTGGPDVFTCKVALIELSPFIPYMDFSPDSKVLAVGTGDGVKLFDVATGKEEKTLAPKKGIQLLVRAGRWVQFSPDGKTLGTLCTNGVALWDVASGKLSRIVGTCDEWPAGFTFRHDGRELANVPGDQSVRFYDPVTGKEKAEAGHPSAVTTVALSPDGKQVVTGSRLESVRFWDRATGKEVRRMPEVPVKTLAFLPGGLLIAPSSRDLLLRLFDPATGKEKGTVGKGLRMGVLEATAVSADSKLLALGDWRIRVYELPSGKKKVTLPWLDVHYTDVAFGPDNKTLITVGRKSRKRAGAEVTYTVELWDLATGKELRRLPHAAKCAVNSVAWSPDGRYVLTDCGTYDFGPKPVADLAKARVVSGPAIGAWTWGRRPMVFSPDGTLLAVASDSGQPKAKIGIDLYDTKTWEKVAVLKGHTQRILSLAFSADGRFLVSGSEDTSAMVWDVRRKRK